MRVEKYFPRNWPLFRNFYDVLRGIISKTVYSILVSQSVAVDCYVDEAEVIVIFSNTAAHTYSYTRE